MVTTFSGGVVGAGVLVGAWVGALVAAGGCVAGAAVGVAGWQAASTRAKSTIRYASVRFIRNLLLESIDSWSLSPLIPGYIPIAKRA
jgi:hypothetical protein